MYQTITFNDRWKPDENHTTLFSAKDCTIPRIIGRLHTCIMYHDYKSSVFSVQFWFIFDNVHFCGNPQKDVFDDVYKLGCRL